MRILIAYGSKRGGTAGLAEMIGDELTAAGLHTVVRPARDVGRLDDFDAVVIAGALYANRWHGDARRFARRHAKALRERPVWLVGSGPLDDSAVGGDIPPVKHTATGNNAEADRSPASQIAGSRTTRRCLTRERGQRRGHEARDTRTRRARHRYRSARSPCRRGPSRTSRRDWSPPGSEWLHRASGANLDRRHELRRRPEGTPDSFLADARSNE